MTSTADRCPKCKGENVSFDVGVCDVGECGGCGYQGEAFEFWPTRAELGLDPDTCEACGRRLSWGCGHSHEQEVEAIAERATVEHQSGACWHYSHADCDPAHCERAGKRVKGYAAFVTHREQAIRYGAADPVTGEPFTSAQRQAWIDTGHVPAVEDTYPVG